MSLPAAGESPALLRSVVFRREREPLWAELATLVERIETQGLRSLTSRELLRLPSLYRSTLSSLGVARSISLDRNLLDYLESLVNRAYLCVYGTRRLAREAIADFLGTRFPRLVRQYLGPIALAALILTGGTVAGVVMTLDDPGHFDSLMDEGSAQGRGPDSSTEELRQVLYDDHDRGDMLETFAAFLFTHNAKIGMSAFALGFLAGVPTFLLLLVNGLGLGALAAVYQTRGLALDFWAWVLPHGITELMAVALCGGAGLVLAQALLFPGRETRLGSLSRHGREAGSIVLGAIGCFLIAGLIEGVFRQLVHAIPLRLAVAGVTLSFWVLYFTLAGRRRT